MNDLQEKEFELLKCFISICDKLNLKYFLVCGSALGTVKYNGFIPWDDDVDVALLREDYKIFCEKAKRLLPEEIFLQTYETDREYPCVFAKLRNSNTTYIEKSSKNLLMNHGVYIDVFPLDGYPKDLKEQKRLERKKLFYKLLISCVFETDCSYKMKILKKIFRFLGIHKKTRYILTKYDELISSYQTETSEMLCNHGNWQGRLEYAPKSQYGEGKWEMFEGLKVRIPEKYDEYLTQKYGDWQQDLPKDKQIGHHYYKVLDLDKPYTEYVCK